MTSDDGCERHAAIHHPQEHQVCQERQGFGKVSSESEGVDRKVPDRLHDIYGKGHSKNSRRATSTIPPSLTPTTQERCICENLPRLRGLLFREHELEEIMLRRLKQVFFNVFRDLYFHRV